MYFADISALQRMQKELADTLAENRMLSQKYLLVQEEERRNLARELHDELGQCVTAIKTIGAAIANRTAEAAPEIHRSAQTIVWRWMKVAL